ncbi:MAG: arginase family protein [Clostridiales bacterium]|nr:arginase family protein [Clostridiales bacterium]
METRPVIYDSSVKPNELYSGVPSYLGLPVAKTPEDLKQYDFAVLGVPWEGGCTIGGFSSCVLAPKTIRETSIRYTGYLPDYDIDIFDTMTLCDYGDATALNGSYELTFASIREKYGELIDAGCIPIVFGGDHSIAYPTISELAKRHKKRVGVIHFDAHLDNYPSFGDDPLARCSPFNRLYQDENMDPTKIVHLGIRGPRNHPQERKEARKYGATVITAKEVKETGYQAAIQKALAIAKKDTDVLYVTVCSDALDGAANPQGPIDPCGLSSFELGMMINECGAAGACSFDFVEIYPETHGPHIGAHTANYFAIYFMNGVARGRLENPGK